MQAIRPNSTSIMELSWVCTFYFVCVCVLCGELVKELIDDSSIVKKRPNQLQYDRCITNKMLWRVDFNIGYRRK